MVDGTRPAAAAGTFRLGGETEVCRMAYGAMRLTGQPGNWGTYADVEGARRVLHRLLDLGVDLIDSAHAYGPGFNEALIAQILHPYPSGLRIATKGGVVKMGPGMMYRDGRPKSLRAVCEASLGHLKVDALDLYQLHWVDDTTPFEDSVGALDDLRREGKIRAFGISNVTVEHIEAALRIAPLASVQNRLGVFDRENEPTMRLCSEHGIAFLPYGPLGAKPFEREAPFTRAGSPLDAVAARHGAKPGQIALAWLLHLSPVVIPIPGTTSVEHLEENVVAAAIQLTEADMAELDRHA